MQHPSGHAKVEGYEQIYTMSGVDLALNYSRMDARFVIALSNAAMDPHTHRWSREFTREDILRWISRGDGMRERDILGGRAGFSRPPITRRTFNGYMGICRRIEV